MTIVGVCDLCEFVVPWHPIAVGDLIGCQTRFVAFCVVCWIAKWMDSSFFRLSSRGNMCPTYPPSLLPFDAGINVRICRLVSNGHDRVPVGIFCLMLPFLSLLVVVADVFTSTSTSPMVTSESPSGRDCLEARCDQ
jgi:hypothetical protein